MKHISSLHLFFKKDDPFIADHAKQALVAQLSLMVAGAVAALKALNGDYYRYPFIQGLVEKL